MVFKEKSDDRDLRPMVYPGRFVFPSPLGDPKKSKWSFCNLRKSHRTEEVKQLSPKMMKEVEDLSADALPTSTDLRDYHIHGAAKYAQIGAPAWEALLSGIVTGVDLSEIPGVILIDLCPRVGDLMEAFCRQRVMHTRTRLFYFGICEDQVELNWTQKIVTDGLSDRYEYGSAW